MKLFLVYTHDTSAALPMTASELMEWLPDGAPRLDTISAWELDEASDTWDPAS